MTDTATDTTPQPVARPLVGYRFEVGCLHCGGPVRQVATGAVHLSWTRALVACCTCGREFTLTLVMELVSTPRHPHVPTAGDGDTDSVRDLDAPFASLIDQILEATYA